jgi:ActR/RegA family two-component response regulator
MFESNVSSRKDSQIMPRILVVEDEDSLSNLLQYNLQKEGFDAVIAGDGEEALVHGARTAPARCRDHSRLDAAEQVPGDRGLPPACARPTPTPARCRSSC